MKQLKHITVSVENYEKLRDLGKTSDSFNDVVSRLLEERRGLDNIKWMY